MPTQNEVRKFGGDTQQIVGRERRVRVSHHDWAGDACLNSRRRVNSDVGSHRCLNLAFSNQKNLNGGNVGLCSCRSTVGADQSALLGGSEGDPFNVESCGANNGRPNTSLDASGIT